MLPNQWRGDFPDLHPTFHAKSHGRKKDVMQPYPLKRSWITRLRAFMHSAEIGSKFHFICSRKYSGLPKTSSAAKTISNHCTLGGSEWLQPKSGGIRTCNQLPSPRRALTPLTSESLKMLHKSSGFCLFFEERKWKKPVAIFLLLRRTAPVATKLKYTSHFPRKDWYSACMTCRMRERETQLRSS